MRCLSYKNGRHNHNSIDMHFFHFNNKVFIPFQVGVSGFFFFSIMINIILCIFIHKIIDFFFAFGRRKLNKIYINYKIFLYVKDILMANESYLNL